ncbi:MAG: gamma-glutamyl-gamma-aminobutyrate hydrolase family protein [Candidatus Aminicenantes bacterium]|nr:gamma-glutamyl-gamma-aminobutyrate hydrolase family protein [Candidatus Aminicenantes bacterium]
MRKKTIILGILSLWLVSSVLFPAGSAKKDSDLQIAICYPSIASIKSLEALIEEGFLPKTGLKVLGVYHYKETSNYKRSERYKKNKRLKWLTFHKVTAELDIEKLFGKNDCTSEFKKIFENTKGIIFFGGADIPPYLYNKPVNLLTQIQTPYRHFFELSFVFHLLGGKQNEDFKSFLEDRPDYPVLGICLGCQSLNVGTGGTLVQDIWMEIYKKTTLEEVIDLGRNNWHTNPYARIYPEKGLFPYNLHPITFKNQSIFCTGLGFTENDQPYILSSHHQAVGELGRGIVAAAFTLDGKVIEAVEHERFPHVLGTQFHPEFPLLYDEEKKIKMIPGEEIEFTPRTFLEKNKPSFSFHKALWKWFIQKVEACPDIK